MLTMKDLLEDSRYKEYLCKVPTLPAPMTGEGREPWQLFVMLKGESVWRTKRFATYAQMFKYFRRLLPRIHDAALHCRSYSFEPPKKIVKIKGKFHTNKVTGKSQQVTKLVVWKHSVVGVTEDYHWCGYCRRPTIFARFTRHHNLPARKTAGIPIDPNLKRCSICGASENIVSLRKTS